LLFMTSTKLFPSIRRLVFPPLSSSNHLYSYLPPTTDPSSLWTSSHYPLAAIPPDNPHHLPALGRCDPRHRPTAEKSALDTEPEGDTVEHQGPPKKKRRRQPEAFSCTGQHSPCSLSLVLPTDPLVGPYMPHASHPALVTSTTNTSLCHAWLTWTEGFRPVRVRCYCLTRHPMHIWKTGWKSTTIRTSLYAFVGSLSVRIPSLS
jgi:hypothetical protein